MHVHVPCSRHVRPPRSRPRSRPRGIPRGILVSILVAEKLDRVMSLAGVILGMSNVLLVPAICHLKLIATTKLSKLVDIAVICIAIFMLFFGPISIISQW